jgi:hypothetical protein
MGCSLMLALPRGAPYFLARVIANFAKFDRVVAASWLAQLYDVAAMKSSCHAGTTRLGSGVSWNAV